MFNRFQRIQREFGTKDLLRIILLIVGLFAMTIFGYFVLSSIIASIITFVGLVLGFLLRKQIADGVQYYSRVVTVGLFIYGIIGFLGDILGIENNVKLAIITATTVIVFDLQFWSLSNPTVINQERNNQE
jgi:uncharacterized membrane protein YjjP (DUF1212 family)